MGLFCELSTANIASHVCLKALSNPPWLPLYAMPVQDV